MRIQAYTAHSFTTIVTIATPRPPELHPGLFSATTVHDAFIGKVRPLLREYKHVGASSLAYPVARRLGTYLPATDGRPWIVLRALRPAGSVRDSNTEYMIDLTRLRLEGTLNLTSAFFGAAEEAADQLEYHLTYAFRRLFIAAQVPHVFVPDDTAIRPGDASDVDILTELGPAEQRDGIDVPAPSA